MLKEMQILIYKFYFRFLRRNLNFIKSVSIFLNSEYAFVKAIYQ